MLYKEIIGVSSNVTKHMNILCRQNAKFLNSFGYSTIEFLYHAMNLQKAAVSFDFQFPKIIPHFLYYYFPMLKLLKTNILSQVEGLLQ
jgi:hypothetical protein